MKNKKELKEKEVKSRYKLMAWLLRRAFMAFFVYVSFTAFVFDITPKMAAAMFHTNIKGLGLAKDVSQDMFWGSMISLWILPLAVMTTGLFILMMILYRYVWKVSGKVSDRFVLACKAKEPTDK